MKEKSEVIPHRSRTIRGIVVGILLVTATAGIGHATQHGISAANLQVVQNDISNNTASVTVTTTLSINDFKIRPGSNRGDYNVQAGLGFSDDVESGAMLACVAENGRDNGEAAFPGLNQGTAALDYSRTGGNTGGFFLSTFNVPSGSEYNINVAAAHFPYSAWIAGYARNSADTNAGPNDLFTGSPGLILGTHFIDQGGGMTLLNLRPLGIDSRKDGVLLVTHGRNGDNYALSQVNSNNGTWTIFVKDNGSNANAYEQGPVSFVYIPRTNASVISGRFRGDGTLLMYSGTAPQFNIVNTTTGTWRLTIPGHSPNTGVLIVSPEGGLSWNQDNIVSYQPDGDGWTIQSRDLPGAGLQTPDPDGGAEPVATFVFIPVTSTAHLMEPVNHAQNLPLSPTLEVALSNSAPGNLTVQFYGRVATVNPATDFAIVLLPDTQYYTAERFGGTRDMFIAQTEWIITNRISRNIAYVAHLGDISDSGDIKGSGENLTEWRNATNAMYRLENPARTLLPYGVPYGVAVGNHDQEPNGQPDGTSIFYNRYFGLSHFAGRSYYAGHYGNDNDNHFDFFSAGGMDFVVLYFEYDTNANPAVLQWANEVLRTNAHRRAIVITHNMGNTQTPLRFSAQGQAIYDALKTNANLFLMIGGHITGEGSRVDTHNGNVVRTYVVDFQGWTNGGNGFMRIMDFSPANNQVVATTYSPWTDEYETDANSEFFFTYNMQQPAGTNFAEFELLTTLTNVNSGSLASFVWSNRAYNTAYEWYVTVTDEMNNTTTGPGWRFSTAPNLPPVASNQLLTIYGDASTNLTLKAYDPNENPLTFQLNSSPQHGLNVNFNPSNGTVTYVPTHGYRGFDRFTYQASDGVGETANVTLNMMIVSPPDANVNGIPDFWETLYAISSATNDEDGDGLNNFQEYIANTNPTNAASHLRITSATKSANGQVTLKWPSVGATRYRLQYSDADASGAFTGVFTDIVRPLNQEMDSSPSGTPSEQSFMDDFTLTSSPSGGARYYRVRIVQ